MARKKNDPGSVESLSDSKDFFPDSLIVKFLLGRREIELLKPFRYYGAPRLITAPAGFICDGASIPRWAWTTIGGPFTGKYREAAVIHDWLYRSGLVTRKEADKIFEEAMEILGVSLWRRKVMHRAVRIGAGKKWKEYRSSQEWESLIGH